VAIKSLDDEPEKIVRRISRRDVADGDWVSVSIDSYEDKITAFVFQVSASGSKGDILKTEAGGEDSSWDPIWEVKTLMQSDGWYAEMRIPYSHSVLAKSRIIDGDSKLQDLSIATTKCLFGSQLTRLRPNSSAISERWKGFIPSHPERISKSCRLGSLN
jgi:hypothetical protein